MDKKKVSSKTPCPKCGQTEYHSGEYPCSECGRPTTWDDPKTLLQQAKNCILHAELDVRDNLYAVKLPESVVLLKQFVENYKGLVAELQSLRDKQLNDSKDSDISEHGQELACAQVLAYEQVLALLEAKELAEIYNVVYLAFLGDELEKARQRKLKLDKEEG